LRIHVREARPADRVFISRLSGLAFRRFGAYAGIIRDWLDSGAAMTLLALSGDRPVGFAMAARIPPPLTAPGETEILAIAVDPGVRRSGIGRLLLRRLETAAREAGAGVIRLHTAAGNLQARALFEGEGYQVLGLERCFYPRGQDAVLMAKEMPPGPP
jgi:ribosomal-protein-alanine N-acetyltransferase